MLRLATALALLALALAGCGPRRIDPPTLRYDSVLLAGLSAVAHARDVGGVTYQVADTHSMEPTLWGGDVIVVAPTPFAELRAGQIITYRATWLPANSPPVTHRLAQRDGLGWILSGDNNAHYESFARVTADNYLGLVVGIYRAKS